ncbi:MAG: hypothetical protein KAW46_01550 [candidate division Zixibacteria bacterium]|nr:hypothetical protein [candidate division Zixibacteria bacterium]
MLKRNLVRVGKAAVMAALVLMTAVIPGCRWEVRVENGHWEEYLDDHGNTRKRCESGGTECLIGGGTIGSGTPSGAGS